MRLSGARAQHRLAQSRLHNALRAQRPLLAAAAGLATGIAAAHAMHGAPPWWPLPCAVAAVFVVVGLYLWRRSAFLPMLFAVVFALAGIPLYYAATPKAAPVPGEPCELVGTVAAVRPLALGAVDYDLRDAQATWADGEVVQLKGRVRVRSVIDSSVAMPGRQLRFSGAELYVPKGQRNPGGFNARMYGYTQGYLYQADAPVPGLISGEENALAASLLRVRLGALEAIALLWPDVQDQAILRALLAGDTSLISSDVRDAFSNLGISHVLAVSGLHMGFVLLLLEGAVRFMFFLLPKRFTWLWGRHRALRSLLVLAGLALYAAFTGMSPSTVRSLIMAGVLLGSRAFLVKPDNASTLGAAVVVMLLNHPADLFSASFQMSAGAVAGIFLLYQPLYERMLKWRIPRYMASSLAVSLSAQLMILPVLATSYGRLPLLGLLANLFAVPLAAAAVMLGLPALLLYAAFPLLAMIPAYPVMLCVRLLERLAHASVQMPLVSMGIAAPTPAVIAVFWFALWLFSPPGRALGLAARKRLRAVCACAGAVAIAAWVVLLFPPHPVLTSLDVGYGSASAVRLGSTTVLIDAGGAKETSDYALQYGCRYDAAFLTALDAGHAGSVEALIGNGKLKTLFIPQDADEAKPAVANLLEAASLARVPVARYAPGDGFTVGGLSIEISAPRAGGDGVAVAVGARSNPGAMLFADRHVAPAGRQSPARIVYLGGGSGRMEDWSDAATPELALYSGRNKPPLADAWQRNGARVDALSFVGAAEVSLGKELRVKRWDKER